jgi:hypothetical protein
MPLDLATLANLASATAVVVAVVFGTLQLGQMRKTRALFTATELVHAMQTTEFTRSVRLVLALPDDVDPGYIRRDPELTAAVQAVSHLYESLGVLVFYRVVHLHLVDDLMGGYVRESWRRLRPYVESRRAELGVYYGEWMQWLAEQLDRHPSPGKAQGAHIAHRGWRPK